MGGVKKKTVSKMRKDYSPKREETKEKEKQKAKSTQEKRIRGLNIANIKEEEVLKEISSLGAITPNILASRFDIRVSVAKTILRELEKKKAVVEEEGNARLRIYKAAA